MPRRMFYFDPPDRFVAGTVGEPGQRTFFLQARKATQVVSVVLEKVQVQVLAERLDQLLDELEERGVTASRCPAGSATDTEPLDEPLVEAFRATTLTLGWDADAGRVLVEARAEAIEIEIEDADEDEDDDAEAPGRGRRRRAASSSLDASHRRVDPGRVRGRTTRTRRPRHAAGAGDCGGRPNVRQTGRAGRRGRPAALPAVRPAARPAGSHVPPQKRPIRQLTSTQRCRPV